MDRGVFNIYVNNGTKIVSCCRLVNSIDMLPKVDSFGNGAINLGSVRVITLNLPRIAIQSKGDINKFYEILDKRLMEIRDLHNVHRNDIIKRRIDAGFLKFFKPLEWLKLENFFSTIGIIGVYEMNKFMGYDLENNDDGILFTENVLKHIEEKAIEIGNDIGSRVNTEEIPGESVSFKFVQKDRVLYGDEKIPFELYSNQYIPLISNASMPKRIEITGKFQDILTGGGILHLNIAEKITDPDVMKHLIKYSVQNGVSHMAINYGFGKCEDNHVTICGNSKVCPICGKNIKTWATRIVGYMTLVDSWSKVRREYEFPKRVFS
jgi:ribonucleoside-triphosphate reductase